MKSINIITAILATGLMTSASAQDFNKEISIEREIVPEERDATRISGNPSLIQPTVEMTKLTMSDRVILATMPSLINRLEPAASAGEYVIGANSPGYVALGYLPAYNLGVSAGYRFYDTEKTKASAWLQFNGRSYEGDISTGEELDFNQNNFVVGANALHRFENNGLLEADVTYSFTSINRPWIKEADNQGISRVWFNAKYTGELSDYDYFGAISLNGVGFTKNGYIPVVLWDENEDLRTISQFGFGLNGGIVSKMVDNSKYGLNFIADFNRYNNYATWGLNPIDGLFSKGKGAGRVMGVMTFNPYWDGTWNSVKFLVGVDLDVAVNSGAALNLAPNVFAKWMPDFGQSMFEIYLKGTGGVHQNTIGSLLDYTQYVNPTFGYGHSRVPLDATVGVTFGPIQGASVELRANYSKANDWLLPVAVAGSNQWRGFDINSFRLGATVSYRSSGLIKSVVVDYDHLTSSDDVYYQWRDQAGDVLNAQLAVEVIKPLDITAGFEARWGRKTFMCDANGGFSSQSLGKSNNLSIGALYRYTDQLSFFVRGENLLNTESYILYDIPAQGLTGLVGATYSF